MAESLAEQLLGGGPVDPLARPSDTLTKVIESLEGADQDLVLDALADMAWAPTELARRLTRISKERVSYEMIQRWRAGTPARKWWESELGRELGPRV